MCHQCVCGEQEQACGLGLCDEHAVEGVAVDGGQVDDGGGVGAVDGEFRIAIVEEAPAQDGGIDGEIVAAEAGFDGDFPQAGCAEVQLGFRGFDQAAGFGGEAFGRCGGPEQQVGIEQEFQGLAPNICSISSAAMRSKSCGTRNWPLRNPVRLGGVAGVSMGTSFATGWPALEMITDSPPATRARRREKWVFASWMLMAGIWGT